MVTDIIKIDGQGNGVEEALTITEKAGQDGGLQHKETIRLRLLAEELIGIMHGIAGNIIADFWIEQNDKTYVLHLKSNINMSRELREQFLEVSSSGTNSAAKGFMGMIRDCIAVALLPSNSGYPAVQTVPIGFMSMGNMENIDAYLWSLQNYKENLDEKAGENAVQAWDELEKSIVASLADEVTVNVVGSTVEIAIFKLFH